MKKKMLVFDFKSSEESFFEINKFDDFEILFFEQTLNQSTLEQFPSDEIESAEIISVFITSSVDKEVLDRFKNLKIISARSTGYNHIDLEESKKRGIAVVNVSSYGERTVAQYTFGLLITLVRKIIPAFLDMKKLENNSQNYVGRDLNSMTIGIIGTGAIGSMLCKAANDVDMKILAFDLFPKDEIKSKYNVEYVDLETLLKNSDVVTLHLPATATDYHMISEKELAMMKDTAYLINTSRGELVDTAALYQALVDKKIQGAALDVGECENFSFDMSHFIEKIPETTSNCLAKALVTQKLIELPNVIVTPHIAYNTEEAVKTILETTFKNIEDFYQGIKTNRIV